MCNECKFITGFWARNPSNQTPAWLGPHRSSNIGPATVPVVKGRQRRCHDSTERYFPGLFPIAADEEYPRRLQIYREENCDWWTLWSIRCPGCGIWKERAAFRKGGAYGVKSTPADPDDWRQPVWDGPHFEDWRCNQCFVKSVGEEEVGRELVEFWKRLATYEVGMFRALLLMGWCMVERIEIASHRQYSWPEIVKKCDSSAQLLQRIPTLPQVEKMDFERRRHYFDVLKRWIKSLDYSADVLRRLMARSDFKRWFEDYEILERRIEELETCTRILEADPSKLVKFGLDGDPPLV